MPLKGEVYSYGRFGGELGALIDHRGHVFRGHAPTDPESMETTTDIPCRLGERFGAFFIVKHRRDSELRSLKIRWEHPLINDPKNRVLGTKTEYPTGVRPLSRETALAFGGWAFDDPVDLVDGDWRVSLVDRSGITIASQSFHTSECPDPG